MTDSTLDASVHLGLGLLPVLFFLAALIVLDSYKLVQLRWVAYLVVAGAAAAWLSLHANSLLKDLAGLSQTSLARYCAPLVEEVLKGAIVVYLIIRKRIGFLVDAAITGFAIGAGFAALENLFYYFSRPSEPQLLVWVIRGFGTAVMHGGVTAIMAIITKSLVDRGTWPWIVRFLPGLALAIVLHSAFNHFFLAPDVLTVLLLVALPLFFVIVFRASEERTREWLGTGFDTDAELLQLITSGDVSESRIGTYLDKLKDRFPGSTVADMLCLLRLRLELSISAKGILLMRQAGFSPEPDPEVEAQFRELKFLEKSIGRTGLLALSPIFHMTDRDLWQYHMLGRK